MEQEVECTAKTKPSPVALRVYASLSSDEDDDSERRCEEEYYAQCYGAGIKYLTEDIIGAVMRKRIAHRFALLEDTSQRHALKELSADFEAAGAEKAGSSKFTGAVFVQKQHENQLKSTRGFDSHLRSGPFIEGGTESGAGQKLPSCFGNLKVFLMAF